MSTIVGYLVIYTLAFMIYGLMEVLGLMPQEITSSGLTLSGIFGKYHGDPVCPLNYVTEFW